MSILVWISFVLLCSRISVHGRKEKETTEELPPFEKVVSCLPFSVKIKPSSAVGDHPYRLHLKGDPVALDAIQHQVQEATLKLTLVGSFQAIDPVHITVVLPKDKLTSVENHHSQNILIKSGFEARNMTIKATAGELDVQGCKVTLLSLNSEGMATVTADGKIVQADVNTRDMSTISVRDVMLRASVDVDGTSKAYVMGSEAKTIDGVVSEMGMVFTDTSAMCELNSMSPIQKRCLTLHPSEAPVLSFEWTQNIDINGQFTCSSDDRGTTASATTSSHEKHGHCSSSSSASASSRSSGSASSSASAHARGSSSYASASSSSSSGETKSECVTVT